MYCQLYFSKYFENNLISSNARKYWSVINLNIELGLFVIIVVAHIKLVHCKGKKLNLIKNSHSKFDFVYENEYGYECEINIFILRKLRKNISWMYDSFPVICNK